MAKLQPELGLEQGELTTETASPAMTREGGDSRHLSLHAPEQAESGPAGPRSDLVSLGTILYEMATGRQPFTDATPAALISLILRDTPRPITAVRPEWRAGLAHIVERCLEKDPDQRCPSAREIRHALTDRRTSTAFEELARQCRWG